HKAKRAWPDQPAKSRELPFVLFEGKAYAFSQHALHDHIYRVIENAVVGTDERRRKKWNDRQKRCSERLALTLLMQSLPGGTDFSSVFYDDQTGTRDECDVVILIDDHLFVLEVKAGAMSRKQPTAHGKSYIERLGALLGEPISQARRFVRAYRSGNTMTLYRSLGDKEGHVTLLGGLKPIVICVTLDQLTDFASQIEQFKALGIEADSTIPVWPVSIDDLRVVMDLLRNPIQFIHFLRERLLAACTPWLYIDDELDHLGAYFLHGRYVSHMESRRSGGSWLQPRGYREQFELYYHALYVGEAEVEAPSRRLPPIVYEILQSIAASGKAGFVELGMMLMDCPFCDDIEHFIGRIVAQQVDGHAAPIVGKKDFPLALYVDLKGGPDISIHRARATACAAMQLASLEHWALLIVRLDAHGRLTGTHHEVVNSKTAKTLGEDVIRPVRHEMYKQRSGTRRRGRIQ
ncbi:MAG: hypothetical protein AAFV54_15360, partial [Pseudomonadota bacterium]